MNFVAIRDTIKKIGLFALPLGVTAILGVMIADGYFWNSEQALTLMVPWLFWSALYTVIFGVSWLMQLPLKRHLAYSAGGATVLVGMVWIMMSLYFYGMPAFAGLL